MALAQSGRIMRSHLSPSLFAPLLSLIILGVRCYTTETLVQTDAHIRSSYTTTSIYMLCSLVVVTEMDISNVRWP